MNWVLIIVGALLTLTGGVWLFQGIGLLPGSVMTGATLWVILGALVAAVGLGLMGWAIARQRRPRP
ncbi:hypothetical protein PX701_00695 [Agromyces sp. H3Y2-19a]|uniref:hypothetical protein n=2 Tax=Agromyces TaxID=33877 RepID=UPI0023B9C81A|nr:hypothetical protein [Agromyces chromiiresistens]MDF0512125.1 hypothetical protein [Agromyces chromiiresistens]